jgi:hypothetical protein
MQGQKSPVRHVDRSPHSHNECFHSWLDPFPDKSMFGCAIWPGWWSAKSKPLGPCAESGEKTVPWRVGDVRPWGEYGSVACEVGTLVERWTWWFAGSFFVGPGDIGVIGVFEGSADAVSLW